MTLGNRDTERSSNLLKEMWLGRTGNSTQAFPGCGTGSLRPEDHYDLNASNLHVVWSRALAGLTFQEPDVKFGNSPFQPFRPTFAEGSSFAQFGFVHSASPKWLHLFQLLGKCHSGLESSSYKHQGSLNLVPPNHGTALTLTRWFLQTAALSVCCLTFELCFLVSFCPVRLHNVVIQNIVRRCSTYMQQSDFQEKFPILSVLQ